jgi:hypothetical protein
MTYFRIQHTKHGQQHKYDILELKRIHAEKNLANVKPYNAEAPHDSHQG